MTPLKGKKHEKVTKERLIRCVCPLDCPDVCGIIARVREGRLVGVEGDPSHPITKGFLCPKVRHYPERVYSPSRVLYPMKRKGSRGSGSFERITWDGAIETIASNFQRIIAKEGPQAIMPYYGSGTLGLVHGKVAGKRFFNRLGSPQLDRTICTKAGRIGYQYTMGTSEGADPRGIPYSKLVISWGTNTFSTNIHQLPLLREARSKGALYAVINPYKVKGAEVADIFLQPRPGSDAALALGMMHVIVKEDLYDRDFIGKNTLGFDKLCQRLEEYPPSRVEKLTGISSKEIQDFARLYAQKRPSFIYVGSGMQHHTNGGMVVRTIVCLPALVGDWGRPGGGMFFPTSTVFPVGWDELDGQELRPNSATQIGGRLRTTLKLPTDPPQAGFAHPFGEPPRRINMNQLGDVLLNGSPKVMGLYIFNANPLAVLFNQNKLIKGLGRPELFTVVHEQSFTDTAYHADILLPATTQFEQVDLHASYFHLSLQLSQQAIEPLGECKSNLEVFSLLARAMGFKDRCFSYSVWDVIEEALSVGHPCLEGVTLDRLKEEGFVPIKVPGTPYVPFCNGHFPTPSGKIEFYSSKMETDGLDPLPAHVPLKEGPEVTPEIYRQYPIYFLTPSAHSFLNANFADSPQAQAVEKRPTVVLHPEDAQARGIKSGDMVRVFNDRGACLLWASVEEKVKPGVAVSMGQWWSRHCPGGANTNHTTPDYRADMGGGSAFNTNLVQIEKV